MAIPGGETASGSRVWGTLKGLRDAISRLTPVDKAFIQFKASLGILLMIPLVQLPSVRDNTTMIFLVLWCAVTVIGFWVSLIGLIMSAQTRDTGYRIELIGLWLLFAGPAVFAALMAGVWIITGQQRAVAVMFAVVICLAVRARMVMIRTADKTRQALASYMKDISDEA